MRRDGARRRVTCDDVAPSLFDIVEGRDDVPAAHAAHAQRCLRCQAEVVQHRKIARVLTRERSRHVEPPSDLVLGVLAAVGAVSAATETRDRWSVIARHRSAYVAAAATAATAGAAAGAFVLTRSRRTRLAPAG